MFTLMQHIESIPEILNGKPKIVNKRISVQNIVVWHEKMGKSVDEISTEFNLTLSEIHAALSYYFDHQSEIDDAIRNDQSLIKQLKSDIPSKLKGKLID
jgi:uncharacterized protein (DUF433 family)